jgi:ABC-type lipoprotein release transport system permease subunit
LGREQIPAVVVGVPLDKLPANVTCVSGRLFREGPVAELVLGSELARRLHLKTGDLLPPFYRSSRGEHVSKVVGIFHSDATVWQANVMFTSLQAAQAIFDQPGQATAFLVNCRPGYEDSIRQQIMRTIMFGTGDPDRQLRPRVVSRQEMNAVLQGNLLYRAGIFNVHFVIIFVVGILVTLVTSGFGLPERRREIGILKATGWQTDEVMLRSVLESLVLSLLGAAAAILLAYIWLRGLNGVWIASLFLDGLDTRPGIPVPFRLAPIPALLAVLISLAMVMTGTLYATWRAATVSPCEAMR